MKIKSLKKLLSIVLVCAFLAQIVPVYAAEGSSKKAVGSEIMSDETTVTDQNTKVPPTFVYDENYTEEKP